MNARNDEIENHLSQRRRRRGVSAAALARSAGVSRQTIYAIEAGIYVPNTAVALRLARALQVDLEELFRLPPEDRGTGRTEEALVLSGSGSAHAGQPVQLCMVNKRLIAVPSNTEPWCLAPSDATLAVKRSSAKVARVNVYQREEGFQDRLLVAGCDPAISVLARHVQASGVRLVLVHCNSSQALQMLARGEVHIAGTHLRDPRSGEFNLPEIKRAFPRDTVVVVAFAVWEEGLITAPGNPKQIRCVADLAREDLSIVNREKGSGSRRLLDEELARAGVPPSRVSGYQCLVQGHLAAGWQVRAGHADSCIATKAAAHAHGLGFVPVRAERYDFAFRKQHMRLPAMQTVLEALNRAVFRRELEGIGGYDATCSGARIL